MTAALSSPRLPWATRETCTVQTYSDHLARRWRHHMYPVALAVLVDNGGEWTVGDDVLIYSSGGGFAPRPCLEWLTLYGYAEKIGDDTWAVTARGIEADLGRPFPQPWWRNTEGGGRVTIRLGEVEVPEECRKHGGPRRGCPDCRHDDNEQRGD